MDNTCVNYGGIMLFQDSIIKNTYKMQFKNTIYNLYSDNNLKILVIDTKMTHSTKEAILSVKKNFENVIW